MVQEYLLLKFLEVVPEEEVSVHQLTCKVGLDHRTVKRYLDLLITIQSAKRIIKSHQGLRVLFRREK